MRSGIRRKRRRSFVRNGLAGILGLNERKVRVIAPNIGGGFGPKIMMFYPEEVLLPWISMKLNRPIKWIETGSSTSSPPPMSADKFTMPRWRSHGRKILGVKDVFLA